MKHGVWILNIRTYYCTWYHTTAVCSIHITRYMNICGTVRALTLRSSHSILEKSVRAFVQQQPMYTADTTINTRAVYTVVITAVCTDVWCTILPRKYVRLPPWPRRRLAL